MTVVFLPVRRRPRRPAREAGIGRALRGVGSTCRDDTLPQGGQPDAAIAREFALRLRCSQYHPRFPGGGMRSDLLPLAATLSARGERFALVTVVRREPPSSARVGDTALITEAGEYHGWAGGGCTRETVVREAQRAMADGEPRFISLSPEANAPRPGMIALQMTCDSGGTVEIY